MIRLMQRLRLGLVIFASLSASAACAQAMSSLDTQTIAPAPFDFYVLSLSWAPSFCASEGEGRGGSECTPGARLGFVVHGLWPQNDRGYPSNCGDGTSRLSKVALDEAREIYPDVGLARHEWRAHGACTGLSPTAYFASVRRARAAVIVPPQFASSNLSARMAPSAAMRAFIDVNPRLRPGMVAIVCRGGALEEARFCMSKDLRAFRPCPDVVRSMCRASDMSVPQPQ